ncbi:hypothetical protein GCM10027072_29770 [Streptomyces bullii]
MPVTCIGRAGRSPGLPAHDRVDPDVRDAGEQEDGRGGVASVMETGVPYARTPKQPGKTTVPSSERRVLDPAGASGIAYSRASVVVDEDDLPTHSA